MFLSRPASKFLQNRRQIPLLPLLPHFDNPPYTHSQKSGYVNVYMRWKKDHYYDSIEHIFNWDLKSLISIKDHIANDPNGCIPISAISKMGAKFRLGIKVARFLRQYPSIFEEFTGPDYNHPWFRLTPKAIALDAEEKRVYETCREDLICRLKKFIMMSKERVLPAKIIRGMRWYLGLPADFFQQYVVDNPGGPFKLVKIGGLDGLALEGSEENDVFVSVMQKNAIKRGVTVKELEFPLFPSRGLRLRRKIKGWLQEFQKLPYVSPYEDFSHLHPSSDLAEKRLVGFFHELLSLFVDHSAQRKKLLCLKKYMGLPQKVHRVFERHPYMFYLSRKRNTCTAILKEPYCNKYSIERHPLFMVRRKYGHLMKESEVILDKRRIYGRHNKHEHTAMDLDLDAAGEDARDIPGC